MRNNKFVITIVSGRKLPFPSIFQSGEFVKKLVHCFHFLNGKIYCYTHDYIDGTSKENLSPPRIGGMEFAAILLTREQ